MTLNHSQYRDLDRARRLAVDDATGWAHRIAEAAIAGHPVDPIAVSLYREAQERAASADAAINTLLEDSAGERVR